MLLFTFLILPSCVSFLALLTIDIHIEREKRRNRLGFQSE